MRKLLIAIAAAVAVSSARTQSSVEHDATAVYALPFKSGSWVRVFISNSDCTLTPGGRSGMRLNSRDLGEP